MLGRRGVGTSGLGVACVAALLGGFAMSPGGGVAQASESKKYPVYVVKSVGLSSADTENMLSSLATKMDDGRVVQMGSSTRFFSRSSMESGTRAVADPQGIGQPGQDDEKGTPANSAEWDIDYLRSAPLVSPDEASNLLSKAFSGIKLGDSLDGFSSSYTTLEIVGPGQNTPIFSGPIRTATSRESSMSGLPVVGPGQSATVNFGSDGRIASLNINVRQLAKTKKQVAVPVGADAARTCRAGLKEKIKGAKYSAMPVYLVSDQTGPGDSIPPVMQCRMFGSGVAPWIYYVALTDVPRVVIHPHPSLYSEDIPGGAFEGRTTARAFLSSAAAAPLRNTGRESEGWVNTMRQGGVPVNDSVVRGNTIERSWLESTSGSPAVVDQVDLAFVASHGNWSNVQLNSSRRPATAFNSNTWTWKLGQQDLEFLVLATCQTLRDGATSGRGGWLNRIGPAFGGLHMLFGAETNISDQPSIGWAMAELVTGAYHGTSECREPTDEELRQWEITRGSAFAGPRPGSYCEGFRELTRGWDPGYFPIQWAYQEAFQFAQPQEIDGNGVDTSGDIVGVIIGTQGSAGIGGTAMDCLMCNLPDQDYAAGASLWRIEFGS